MKVVNEFFIFLFVDSSLASGEVLKLFVRVRAVVFAHNSLDGLSQKFVMTSEFFS